MRARLLRIGLVGLVTASSSFALVGVAQTRGPSASSSSHGKPKAKPAADADAGAAGASGASGAHASDATVSAGAASAANAATAGSPSNGTNGQSGASPAGAGNPVGAAGAAGAAGSSGTASRPSTTASWPDVYDGGAKPSPLTPAPDEHLVPASAALGSSAPDYDKTIADIALLRARVAAVSDALFRSRLALTVQLDSDKQRLEKMVVALDDGPVWEAPNGFRADDAIAIYDHAVAPGRHAISVHIERKDSRDASFSTEQTSRFIVDVPKDQRLEVGVRLEEDSSMGGSFPDAHRGDYDLRIRVKAAAKPVGK